jgi:hypothetical protein
VGAPEAELEASRLAAGRDLSALHIALECARAVVICAWQRWTLAPCARFWPVVRGA